VPTKAYALANFKSSLILKLGCSFATSNSLLPVGKKESSLLLHQMVSIIVIHDEWLRRRKEG
jgi:hypothetical protein